MKKLVLASLLLLMFLVPVYKKVVAAELGMPFGGLVTATLPCTCPPYGLWVQYSLLFLGNSTPITGALYFPPVFVLYSWFNLGVPSTWNLGSVIPGPGQCNMLTPTPAGAPTCLPLPAMGTVQYTGTSLPGGFFSF